MNLRRHWSVQARPATRDESGERSRDYEHKFFIWTEAPREGATSLQLAAGLEITEDTYRMRTRYRSGIDVGDKLVDDTDELFIRAAHDVDGTLHWLQLVVTRSPSPAT